MTEYPVERDKVITATKEAGRKLAGWFILPRWKAIKDIPGILPIEDLRELFKTHRRFALLPCSCNVDDRKVDCDLPNAKCLTFDRGADFRIDVRKDGRELTLKEALDFLDDMGKYPVVSMPMGVGLAAIMRGQTENMALCSCHWDCCLGMTPYYIGSSKYKVSDFCMKTRFRATVDPEKCIACRRCVEEMCQFGAAQMKYYPEFSEERAYIDEDKCMGCGSCVERCTVSCRGMKLVEPPEYYTTIDEREGIRGGSDRDLNVEGVLARANELLIEKKLAEEKK